MDCARRARVSVSLALLALLFGGVSCAKHDLVAERNAEIDRRIDQRLAAREEAAAQQRLAQQQADLAAREKVLAAREASFATLIASMPAAPAPAATEPVAEPDSSLLASDSYVAPQTYSTYPEQGVSPYAKPYGYVASNAPFYSDPYFCPPATAFFAVINQNAVIVNPCRDFHRPGMGRPPRENQPAPPAVPPTNQPRPPVISRPPVMPRPPVIVRQPPAPRPTSIGQQPPVPTVGQRPTRSSGAPQVATRRVASKPVLAQTR